MRIGIRSVLIAALAIFAGAMAAASEPLRLRVIEADVRPHGSTGEPTLHVRFDPSSARATVANLGREVAVCIEGKEVSRPIIVGAVLDGSTEIGGDFTAAELEALVPRLVSGELLIELVVVTDQNPEPCRTPVV